MPFAGKWMELEIITLSEISWSAKPSIECFLTFVKFRGRKNGY
jgi:hypothetical protein